MLALLLMPALALAIPSSLGFTGVWKTLDARTIGANEIAFNLLLSYYSAADQMDVPYYPQGSSVDTILSVEDKELFGRGTFNVAYGITDFLEGSIQLKYLGTYYQREDVAPRSQTAGEWDGAHGLGDAMVGLKAGFCPTPSNEVLWLGLANWYQFAPRQNETVTVSDYDGRFAPGMPLYTMRRPMLSTGHTTFGIDGLVTLDMVNIWSTTPFRFHLNAGYAIAKQSIGMTDYRITGPGAYSDSQYVSAEVEDNIVNLGLAVEFPTQFAIIFSEVDVTTHLDRDVNSTVAYFRPGIRFLNKAAIVDVVFHLGLSDFDPTYFDFGHGLYQSGSVSMPEREQRAPLPMGGTYDWGVSVGFGFSSDMIDRGPTVTTGTISGMVTGMESGEPLSATVSFPGTAVGGVSTDSVTGFYTATVPEGSVPVTVATSGYAPKSATVVLEAGQDVVVDFQLEKNTGQIAGTITEFENGDPLVGTVTIIDTEEPITAEVGEDGVFQMGAPAGTWTVSASAEGYVTKSQPVVVPTDETVIVDFVLRPALEEGQVMSFDNIYFDVGSANLRPESYSILDNMVEILMANPDALVQIAGHTDSDGSESYNQTLSEQRANSVFTYLVQHGVSASKLTTVGYGESQPVVPNTSTENKARNRRIEFTVLSI